MRERDEREEGIQMREGDERGERIQMRGEDDGAEVAIRVDFDEKESRS